MVHCAFSILNYLDGKCRSPTGWAFHHNKRRTITFCVSLLRKSGKRATSNFSLDIIDPLYPDSSLSFREQARWDNF